MITIDIDKIIARIRDDYKVEWSNYIKGLSRNHSGINTIPLNYTYEKEGIVRGDKISLISCKNPKSGTIRTIREWAWGSKSTSFTRIESQFIKIFFDQVKFCPYCGKCPLLCYGDKKKHKAFDMDHIYPWTQYSYLTFNLYNLIPVCKMCNNMKNAINLADKGDYFHPYFGYINKDRVSIDKNKSFDSEYDFENLSKILNSEHAQFFHLTEIYQAAKDSENDMAFILDQEAKILSYGKNYGVPVKDIINDYFKNYVPEERKDILKFANGKLKNDILIAMKKRLGGE